MFNTLIVQPIFNLLVLIYSLLPGHNFGLAIIIFTVLVRLAMWPLGVSSAAVSRARAAAYVIGIEMIVMKTGAPLSDPLFTLPQARALEGATETAVGLPGALALAPRGGRR